MTTPAMITPAAVLWDMDGTLVDSEKVWTVSLADTARALGGRLSAGARDGRGCGRVAKRPAMAAARAAAARFSAAAAAPLPITPNQRSSAASPASAPSTAPRVFHP